MTSESPHFSIPEICEIPAGRPFSWLRRGFDDLRANPLASLFYGSCFAGMGMLLHAVFSYAVEYISALAMGFVLVGPFLAIGLYDLSHQREQGRKPRLGPSLTAWRASLGATGIYVLILTVIFLVWARASLIIFALFYTRPMPTMAGFIGQVLSIGNVNFLALYFGDGLGFAALTFALSVVSVRYLLDGNADAVTAAATSVPALARNGRAMLVSALLIAALIGAGLATFYLGLVFTVPLIGHATWHAYRDLVKA